MGMIQMPTTQLTPVGVGWGNYVIAWLLTYQGSNCELWRHVYDKCMESELCRRVIEILPTIGYNLMRHKCYADLDAEIEVETEQAKPPNNASTKPTSTTTQKPCKRSKTKPLKTKTPKPLRALEIKAPPLSPPSLPQPSPPRWAAPDRGAHWV